MILSDTFSLFSLRLPDLLSCKYLSFSAISPLKYSSHKTPELEQLNVSYCSKYKEENIMYFNRTEISEQRYTVKL